MEKIIFSQVLPHVFSHREDLHSEVWQQQLTLEKGKTYLVQADSGKGKSTFCSYIVGYRHDFEGSLTFDSQEVKTLKVKDWVTIRRQHISHLFQELRLFPELTALENVEIKNKITNFKQPKDINNWFEMLGIADKMHSKIGLMSFGQQQRVAMIRSLVQPFDFLLADEPISHLDDTNSQIMGQMMMTEAKRQGAAVIVTSIGKHMDLAYDQTFRL